MMTTPALGLAVVENEADVVGQQRRVLLYGGDPSVPAWLLSKERRAERGRRSRIPRASGGPAGPIPLGWLGPKPWQEELSQGQVPAADSFRLRMAPDSGPAAV